MDDPAKREEIAELYAGGDTPAELGRVYHAHPDTVKKWLRRPDMKALISAFQSARADRIKRTVDAAIMARLETPAERAKLSLKDFLEIRKTFVPAQLEVGRPGDAEAAAAAIWEQLDSGGLAPPELVEGTVVEEDEDV